MALVAPPKRRLCLYILCYQNVYYIAVASSIVTDYDWIITMTCD